MSAMIAVRMISTTNSSMSVNAGDLKARRGMGASVCTGGNWRSGTVAKLKVLIGETAD
jgi:hypothetical protein